MSLFNQRPPIIDAYVGVYPPAWVGGPKVAKVCLQGVDDPTGNPLEWSDASPSPSAKNPATTWRVSSTDRRSWEYPVDEILTALARNTSGAESKKIIRVILASRRLYFEDPLATQGRKRITFEITNAGYVPEYAAHESTARRRQRGERVAEVEVDFDPPWDHTGPTAYRILLDSDAITKMEFLGIRSATGMVGRTATIETDDVQSLLQPVRLIDIR